MPDDPLTVTEETDEVLAARAARGDRAAFEHLVRRHKSSLYRFTRRYVGDADDAYDVVQDSFVAAWLALGRFDPRRPFGTWLKTIALNKCRDLGRRARTRRLFLRALAVAPVDRASSPPDEPPNDREVRLDRAIASLPVVYKEPLLLTTVGGLSQYEASRILGVSPKAVEMRLRRARLKLMQHLAQTEG